MSITRWAIENDRITTVAVLAVLFAGIAAYSDMPRDEDPGFIIRIAQVVTIFPGASPERVEQLITDPLEKAIMEMPELAFVQSISKTGASIVLVNVKESYKDMQPIWDRLRRKVERVAPDLPDGIIGPRVNDEFGDVFGIVLTLTGEGFSYAELEQVAEDVRDELLLIDDAAKVEIYGAQEERVFVEYNNAQLAKLGLTPMQLLQLLAVQNVIIPGGSVTTGDERIVLEPSGNFESVDELRRTIVQVPGRSDVVYLGDIAEISRDYVDPPDRLMRANGVPALGLGVSMREGGNIITLGHEVMDRVRELEAGYPIGVDFDVASFQPGEVERKVGDFEGNLLQSVLIVLLVMLVALGLRTGVLVASLIPSAIIMALLIMSLMDIGLDQVSLAALIIALGMLVDNAIVMSESILVQMRAGKAAVDAAVDSASELRIPLLTSSLTTCAAFLPIYLAESATGEYTAPLFKVVTITLLCSWLLALTMIPMLAVKFMSVKVDADADQGPAFGSWFYRGYRATLLGMLRWRWVTLLVTAAVFVGAMGLFQFVPKVFFPPHDRAFLTVRLAMPVGTPIERTSEVTAEVEAFMGRELMHDSEGAGGEGVTSWSTYVGGGEPRFILNHNPKMASPDYGVMLVNTTSAEVIADIIPKIESWALERFPDLELIARRLEFGPPVSNPIEVRVSARDTGRLFELVEDTRRHLTEMGGAKNITDDWGRRSKKLVVHVNDARARRAGVSNQDVALSLQTVLSGFSTTELRQGNKVIPITMRSVIADRQDLSKLETLNVYSSFTGRPVPLNQVADLQLVWQPSVVLRRDGLRTATVSAGLEPGFNAAAMNAQLDTWLETQRPEWGAGVRATLGGEMEKSGKANKSIGDKLPVAGFIILVLLVGQFNSMRRATIILCTIPLGLVGVVLGLLGAGSYMGFMTFLGIISLAGIVINNAIVLLERIEIESRDNGLEIQRAVVQASQMRMRPILLTTATTIGGLLPLWFGGGVMFQPMAIAIIFGLLLSTALTLGVVPVLYSLFFRVSYRGFSW